MRSGLVETPAQDVDTLRPAQNTEHDLPVGVLVIELPPGGTEAGLSVAGVVTLELVSEGVSGLPVRVSVRDEDAKLARNY